MAKKAPAKEIGSIFKTRKFKTLSRICKLVKMIHDRVSSIINKKSHIVM